MAMDERQAGDVLQLLPGGGFDGHAPGPGLDRRAACGLDQLVVAHDSLWRWPLKRRSPSAGFSGEGLRRVFLPVSDRVSWTASDRSPWVERDCAGAQSG